MIPMLPASQERGESFTPCGVVPTLYRASLMGNRIQVMERHSQDEVVKDCSCLGLPPSSVSPTLSLSPAITPCGRPSFLQCRVSSSEPLRAVSLVRG